MSTPNGTLTASLGTLLLQCLCSAVQEQPNPPQHCCMRAGTEPAQDADFYTDLCCEGMAYVMPGDTWPTYIFPDLDIVRQAEATCGVVSWAMEFRMGIMRCAPAGTETTMPTCADWTTLATQMIYDAESLRRAYCCFTANARNTAQYPLMDGMSISILRQQQGTVQGGCVERWTTVQIQIPTSCCSPLPVPVTVGF